MITVSIRLLQNHLKQYRRQKRPINRKIVRREPRVDPRELGIKKDVSDAEADCVSATIDQLTWANTRLYVDANYPTDESKQAIRDEVTRFADKMDKIFRIDLSKHFLQTNSIIRSILVAFRAQVDLLDWMSPASKRGAYQKIDNLVVNIAFPDWVLDDAKLTEYYKVCIDPHSESDITLTTLYTYFRVWIRSRTKPTSTSSISWKPSAFMKPSFLSSTVLPPIALTFPDLLRSPMLGIRYDFSCE